MILPWQCLMQLLPHKQSDQYIPKGAIELTLLSIINSGAVNIIRHNPTGSVYNVFANDNQLIRDLTPNYKYIGHKY